jgi:DNA-binding LytR/AlgR family response regulator
MYSCVIVDDQSDAINLIVDHIAKVPILSLVLKTTNPFEALAFFDNNRADILFLDIEMPDISGIEFIESLKSKWGNNLPRIILITGFTDYALSGYEYGVFDYIIKPITFTRFKKCIDRISNEPVNILPNDEKPKFFFIEENGRKIKTNFADIVYIEGAGNYIVIVTVDSKKILYKSMTMMWNQLPHDRFLRVHKSYIIAIDKIHSLRGNELIVIVKNSEINIPIGITYKENILKQLGIN